MVKSDHLRLCRMEVVGERRVERRMAARWCNAIPLLTGRNRRVRTRQTPRTALWEPSDPAPTVSRTIVTEQAEQRGQNEMTAPSSVRVPTAGSRALSDPGRVPYPANRRRRRP